MGPFKTIKNSFHQANEGPAFSSGRLSRLRLISASCPKKRAVKAWPNSWTRTETRITPAQMAVPKIEPLLSQPSIIIKNQKKGEIKMGIRPGIEIINFYISFKIC